MKPEDLEKLVTMPMPFGKHKGMLIADLPGNYLNWFAREGFPKGEVGQLLQLMHFLSVPTWLRQAHHKLPRTAAKLQER